ncbi:Arc family DNA-binding protein [Methylocystis heyeri]|uniref:Arc family DNA-binding protein n=1 Tax=Methylocystis heyeri TaxID=391905 RepID=A0A6B8KG14_9HYPH|nr:Arc family DNA-binding protein [Methylocystis heyeri]QGM46667.1 Arc family DNA-binding protein [Methylocystis heyeri]
MTAKTQINIRVPADVKSWLSTRAEANSRTINGEILAILKDAKNDETKRKQASNTSKQ